jgi:8-oxo-dGTP pyrophosphatase MutT (NUDIX family)
MADGRARGSEGSDPSPGSKRPPGQEIPRERLPEGFADRVEKPPEPPAEARPAATVVLMRAGAGSGDASAASGLEVLLLRRVRTSGFVPGAYVFPGGRVDRDDAAGALLERLDGMSADDAAERLGMAADAEPPAVAYVVAALREAFEETGILVGHDADGAPAPSAASDPAVRRLRDDLLADEDAFPVVLDAMGCRMDGRAVAYIAHWITPVAEPRRYDTRFFAAAVSPEREELLNAREMSHGVWLSPGEALARHERGELPMVFPTVRTLEDLAAFSSPEAVLAHWADREVPTVLPRLVRTRTGVGIELD